MLTSSVSPSARHPIQASPRHLPTSLRPVCGASEPRAGTALHSERMGLRICLVTPFAWSQPHDVNEHVAGRREGATGSRPLRDGARVVEPGARSRRRSARAPRRARHGGGRARPGRADLAPQPDRRAGRRTREPLACARARAVRHRPRLRARAAVALVSGACGRAGADRRDLPDRRSGSAIRLGGHSATACWAARRARRHERANGARRRRFAFPGSTTSSAKASTSGSSGRAQAQRWSCSSGGRTSARSLRGVFRALADLADWELVLLRTKPLTGRPTIPRVLARPRARANCA